MGARPASVLTLIISTQPSLSPRQFARYVSIHSDQPWRNDSEQDRILPSGSRRPGKEVTASCHEDTSNSPGRVRPKGHEQQKRVTEGRLPAGRDGDFEDRWHYGPRRGPSRVMKEAREQEFSRQAPQGTQELKAVSHGRLSKCRRHRSGRSEGPDHAQSC